MQKLYYSISEVCNLVDEEQHILRYWEKEFSQLKPRKNRGGNRIYSSKDIQLIFIIKKLLREDKLSLKGAKEKLPQILENTEFDDIEYNLFKDNVKITDNSSQRTKVENFNHKLDKKDINDLLNILKKFRQLLQQ